MLGIRCHCCPRILPNPSQTSTKQHHFEWTTIGWLCHWITLRKRRMQWRLCCQSFGVHQRLRTDHQRFISLQSRQPSLSKQHRSLQNLRSQWIGWMLRNWLRNSKKTNGSESGCFKLEILCIGNFQQLWNKFEPCSFLDWLKRGGLDN